MAFSFKCFHYRIFLFKYVNISSGAAKVLHHYMLRLTAVHNTALFALKLLTLVSCNADTERAQLIGLHRSCDIAKFVGDGGGLALFGPCEIILRKKEGI